MKLEYVASKFMKIKMIDSLKNILQFVRHRHFKNAQVGLREIVIIAISLIVIGLVLYRIVKMFNVSAK